MRPIPAALAFLTRHFLFVVFAIVAGCMVWTAIYFCLLLLAAFTGAGIGGPFALPAGIMLVIGTGAVVGWGVFTPACAIGEIFRRMANLPRLAAIPVVFVMAGVISCLGYMAFVKSLTTHPTPPVSRMALHYIMYLCAPLAVYWWLTEGPLALFEMFRGWLRKKRHQASPRPGRSSHG